MHERNWRAFGILPGIALVWAAAGPASGGEPIHEEVSAPADGEVRVENVVGSVVITAWNEKKVRVEGTLGDGSERVDVDADEDGVDVEVVLPRRARDVEDTDLELRVPRGSDVEVETVSASVEIEGIEGIVEVETVSGTVHVREAGDDVAVETVSGAVSVHVVDGVVQIESVSGEVGVEECQGSVEISTTSGAISVGESQLDEAECETVSGTIELDFDVVEDGDYNFENFSGDVTLHLDDDVNACVCVETFSGRIHSDFDGRAFEEKYGPGASLTFKRGDADADITVDTFSGTVQINKR